MVGIFTRAAILTAVILASWFLLSSSFEGERNNQLLTQIDNVITEESAISNYLDYLDSTGNTERYCSVLEQHIRTQNKNLFDLLGVLEQARQNSLNNQYSAVRKRFQAANSQLFFSLKQFETRCTQKEKPLVPILYFFTDTENCSDCGLQAQILNELGKACQQPIQVFAFPIEGGIEPIELLVKDYNITKVPSLVIDENIFVGVQSPSKLNELLQC